MNIIKNKPSTQNNKQKKSQDKREQKQKIIYKLNKKKRNK